MTILGFEIARRPKAAPPPDAQLVPVSGISAAWSGWWPVVRESFTGAWQRNIDLRVDNVTTFFAVFACVTLIASDIGKVRLRLVQKDDDGIWTETKSNAFSPVLRKPNHYQTINQFLEQWITSLLLWGNAYILLERDRRQVVVAMYVLAPSRVQILVSPEGEVFYQLDRDDLSGLTEDGSVTVPASEMIHDRINCLFHPLIGLSPIYASGMAAVQGLKIQGNSAKFFANDSRPGGLLIAPGAISKDTATRLKTDWQTQFGADNYGKIGVLGDGVKYEPLAMPAHDAQLIEQLNWTGETVCSTFHVPKYLVGIGPPPPYANIEPLLQNYYNECLQRLMTSNVETALDLGMGLLEPIDGVQFGTEFDIDDLIWMDTKTRTEAARTTIAAGALSPNEARKKYFGYGPVVGGESPMVQQQYFSLAALAERDAEQPFSKTVPPSPPAPATRGAAETVVDLEALARALDAETFEEFRRVA